MSAMRVLFILIVGLTLQLSAATSLSQTASRAERDALQSLVARGALPQLHRPDFARFRPALEEVYRETDFAPRWVSTGSAPRAMFAELADAPSHGLDAADYDVDWLGRELSAIQAGDRSNRVPATDPRPNPNRTATTLQRDTLVSSYSLLQFDYD